MRQAYPMNAILDVGPGQGIIGAYFFFGEKTIGQGRDKAVEFLKLDYIGISFLFWL